jgi:hypothetical protein
MSPFGTSAVYRKAEMENSESDLHKIYEYKDPGDCILNFPPGVFAQVLDVVVSL